MFIGRLSELTSVSRKAIRHYESIGLIPTPQRRGNYRIYTERDVTIIRMVRQAKTLGFSLAELKEFVSKKASADHFPLELACELIDQKQKSLKQEADSLLLKARNLEKIREELVQTFA